MSTSHAVLSSRLREELAAVLSLRATEIDVDVSLRDYGLDSVLAPTFVGRVERALGVELDVLVLFDHPTIAKLAAHLAQGSSETR
jgi:aryl carrier-like protein